MLRLLAIFALLVAPSAQAVVAIDWVTVGDPGNAGDTDVMTTDGTTGYGAVAYEYRIAKYEVTNAQYVEFLNAVAATDTNDLYDTRMGSENIGGITRSGSSGGYAYTVKISRDNDPVNYVSFWSALRFANWMHNGQPAGMQDEATTEDGAYVMNAACIFNNAVTRKPGALFVVQTEHEWYKAAYYKGGGMNAGYWDYPTGSDTQPPCEPPGAVIGSAANCDYAVAGFTPVGAYPNSPSPYGTFDQGGNAWEWNESVIDSDARGIRGGSYDNSPNDLAATYRDGSGPDFGNSIEGFRLATQVSVPSVDVPSIEWVMVGDPGNDCDSQAEGCFGSVGYTYEISKYEITNDQYSRFLNIVAKDDPNGLFTGGFFSGIARTGSPGNYSYEPFSGAEQFPATDASFYSALRFANWLHNNEMCGAQGGATTESGAYTFSGPATVGARKSGAGIFVPTEDEWYKAAYYDKLTSTYFDYPAASNTETTCAVPGATPNTGNCALVLFAFSDVGAYSGSESPNGTFDQGGNVMEWNEAIFPPDVNGERRGARGGHLASASTELAASARQDYPVQQVGQPIGIRIVKVSGLGLPVPSVGPIGLLLVAAGLVGFCAYRRGRA